MEWSRFDVPRFFQAHYSTRKQDYHRLIVWQKAHDLTLNIQRATRSFKRAGCIGLRTQIVRAAEAIPTNIVEGCFAASPKEFARFLDISIKSTGEVEYQLQLARITTRSRKSGTLYSLLLQWKSAGCSSGYAEKFSRHRRQSRWYFLLATELLSANSQDSPSEFQ